MSVCCLTIQFSLLHILKFDKALTLSVLLSLLLTCWYRLLSRCSLSLSPALYVGKKKERHIFNLLCLQPFIHCCYVSHKHSAVARLCSAFTRFLISKQSGLGSHIKQRGGLYWSARYSQNSDRLVAAVRLDPIVSVTTITARIMELRIKKKKP